MSRALGGFWGCLSGGDGCSALGGCTDAGCYYKEVLEPELEAMAGSESEKTREMGSRYRTAVTGYDGQYQISREAEGVPEEYEAAQARARDAFWENTIHGYFRLEEAEEETASQEAVGEAGDSQADAGDAAAHLLTVWSDFLRVVGRGLCQRALL